MIDQNSTTLYIQAGGSLNGECVVIPGDKSISHRAVMLAAIAEGTSHISHFLSSEDCLATINIFKHLGADIQQEGEGCLRITGVGINTDEGELRSPTQPLNCGNSGTTMRLLLGILTGQGVKATLTGDQSLLRRPMLRVVKPLLGMGADIVTSANGTAPLEIRNKRVLHSATYILNLASAQVKSCFLLAAISASGISHIIEDAPSRNHTEKMLKSFAYPMSVHNETISLLGGCSLLATDIQIPGDISSAAFFIVGTIIAPGSKLSLKDVGVNPTRMGVITILKDMGAKIILKNIRQYAGEEVADIEVSSANLTGIKILQNDIPLAIDEFPIIFIAAACATGTTYLRGAAELRVKETDRLQVMAEGLQKLGIAVELFEDGISITGGQLQGGRVNSYGDHRIAMAFAIAGLRAQSEIIVEDCENIKTSFPTFVAMAKQLGLKIEEKKVC
jgi:3-phosphoshikimate 1-carboxyvinyltransferase